MTDGSLYQLKANPGSAPSLSAAFFFFFEVHDGGFFFLFDQLFSSSGSFFSPAVPFQPNLSATGGNLLTPA